MNTHRYRNHKSTQKSYDRLSVIYDFFSSSEDETRQKALDLMAPKAGESILEIGFGTGHALAALSDPIGPAGRIVGVDISTGMARAARKRLSQDNKAQNICLTTADTTCLPFVDHSFDAILSTFTLELFDSVAIPLVLRECWRVLMPGGRIVIAALNEPSAPNTAIVIYEWFHRALPRLVDCHPIPVEQHLTKAGFQIAEITCVPLWGLPVLIASSYKKSA